MLELGSEQRQVVVAGRERIVERALASLLSFASLEQQQAREPRHYQNVEPPEINAIVARQPERFLFLERRFSEVFRRKAQELLYRLCR